MGNLAIPLYTIFKKLNFQVIIPPPTTDKTIKLGAKYAPEQICLPFKINLGNLLESYSLGADTFVMLGGCGPCRFGFYGNLLHEILLDLGLNYNFINFDEKILATIKELKIENNLSWQEIFQAVQLGWEKLLYIETLEEIQCSKMTVLKKNEQLKFRQTIENIFQQLLIADTLEEVRALRDLIPKPSIVPSDALKLAVVGDIYTMFEPRSNFYLENELLRRGIYVTKTIKISTWLKNAIIGWERSKEGRLLLERARPYLNNHVGGHGLHTIGNTVLLCDNVDGVIQVMPLNCTPEIVAASVMPTVSADKDLPVLSLIFDEHVGHTAVLTRIEAFIDLLDRKKTFKKDLKRGD